MSVVPGFILQSISPAEEPTLKRYFCSGEILFAGAPDQLGTDVHSPGEGVCPGARFSIAQRLEEWPSSTGSFICCLREPLFLSTGLAECWLLLRDRFLPHSQERLGVAVFSADLRSLVLRRQGDSSHPGRNGAFLRRAQARGRAVPQTS